MNKYIIILVLNLLTSILVFGGNNKYEKVTLHFRDGSAVYGLAKVVQDYKIKFKVSENSKADIWSDLMVKGITFHGEFEDYKYDYIYLSSGYVILAEVIEYGYISLYVKSDSYWTPNIFNSSSNFPVMWSEKKTTLIVYIKRKDEKYATYFKGNFKKRAKSYFKDCIGLIEKIDSGEFNKKTIPEMVYYYNDFCAE